VGKSGSLHYSSGFALVDDHEGRDPSPRWVPPEYAFAYHVSYTISSGGREHLICDLSVMSVTLPQTAPVDVRYVCLGTTRQKVALVNDHEGGLRWNLLPSLVVPVSLT
jgi:hypothetical protein